MNPVRCESVVSDGYYELAHSNGGKKGLQEVQDEREGQTAAEAEKAELGEGEMSVGEPVLETDMKDGDIKITFDLEDAAQSGSQAEQAAAKKLLAGVMSSVAEELKKKLKDAQEKAEEGKKERKRTVEEIRRAREGVGEGRVIVDAEGRARVVDETTEQTAEEKEKAAEIARKIREKLEGMLGTEAVEGAFVVPVEGAQQEEPTEEAITDWMKEAEKELREEEKGKTEYAVQGDEEDEEGVVLDM